MQAMLRLAPQVLQALPADRPEATKAVAELAMALEFLAQAHGPQPALRDLAVRLMDHLATDAHLALSGHPFLLARALTPYVFLRCLAGPHPVWERLLAGWLRSGPVLHEATPYRRMERLYLRAKAGAGPLPGWRGAAVLRDARQAWAFDRDMAYAFSHVVLFCTDFAAIRRPDPRVKGVGLLLLAEALERVDVDLVWELALCLLTQDLAAPERAEVISAAVEMRGGLEALCAPERVAVSYHPVLVHDILSARLHQHLGRDLAAEPAGPRPLLQAIGRFRNALAGKDAAAMVAAEAALPRADWSARMLRLRLLDLHRRVRDRTLFLRETCGADHDGPLYADYARQIGDLLRAGG